MITNKEIEYERACVICGEVIARYNLLNICIEELIELGICHYEYSHTANDWPVQYTDRIVTET